MSGFNLEARGQDEKTGVAWNPDEAAVAALGPEVEIPGYGIRPPGDHHPIAPKSETEAMKFFVWGNPGKPGTLNTTLVVIEFS